MSKDNNKNNNIPQELSQINPDYLNELEDKAFQVLPHLCIYDENREVKGMIAYTEETRPELAYEEFIEQLDFYRENEDTKAIISLDRELERIDKGINLAVDVSEFPEPDWLVEGFVVRKGLNLLYGDSGTGKTTLCLYVADRMQKGKDLFGLECKQGKVLFVENDESGELLKSHRDKVGLPERLLVANTDVIWNVGDKKFNKEFSEMLYYYIPDVVVIDAYTSLGIPDITRPESALVLDELRRLAKTYNCAMIIVHHTNLSGEQMGSNLHRAKMDSIMNLSKLSDDKITLNQDKIRGAKITDKIIDFNQNTLEMKEGKMSLRQAVYDLIYQGVKRYDLKAKFPQSKRATIDRYARDAETKLAKAGLGKK